MVNKIIKLRRLSDQPILFLKKEHSWEATAVFNCAAICKEGKIKIHVLYRSCGDYLKYAVKVDYAIYDKNLNLMKRFDKLILERDIKVWKFK